MQTKKDIVIAKILQRRAESRDLKESDKEFIFHVVDKYIKAWHEINYIKRLIRELIIAEQKTDRGE